MSCRASSSFFNRTTLLHIGHVTLRLLEQVTPAFIPPDLWPPNSPDLNPVDCKIWASSRSESTSHGRTVSTNWSSVCFMFGMGWTKASLTVQLMNGVCVFVLVCEQRVDTTSTCCEIISMPIYTTMWHETFYVG